MAKVTPDDGIMVDRWFNIADLTLQRGATPYMQPFTRNKREGNGKGWIKVKY